MYNSTTNLSCINISAQAGGGNMSYDCTDGETTLESVIANLPLHPIYAKSK